MNVPMDLKAHKAQIIGGEFTRIIARQRSAQDVEIGELLVANNHILQVFDLCHASQISQLNREMISGMELEQQSSSETELFEEELRNYTLLFLKTLLTVDGKAPKTTKTIPKNFSVLRELKKEDVSFLTTPHHPLFIGNLRSGSKMLDLPVNLPGDKVFSHHVLVAATTGRGKSNLTSVMLYESVDKEYCGILVLDPHDEYYGRNGLGLKDHPKKEKVSYYTARNAPPGTNTLRLNLQLLKPHHFSGAVEFSGPQRDALFAYYREFGAGWIEAIAMDKPLKLSFHENTIGVVKRKLLTLLDLDWNNNQLSISGTFCLDGGMSTIADICNDLERSKKVIIDTSSFSGATEILIGSIIVSELYGRYKHYTQVGSIKDKPVISIVIEEAPRVLGKEVLEEGQNIFSTIAREGRKFKVGLYAITQLPSLIPRQILANINTKIILGIEMAPERQALIESSAQDLSSDNRAIASLDIGEAIISSNFTKFALPVKIPLFKDVVNARQSTASKVATSFSGIKLK